MQLGAEAGIPVFRVQQPSDLVSTALYVVPTLWFVATAFPGSGELNVGR
jgi:hypothetical protein